MNARRITVATGLLLILAACSAKNAQTTGSATTTGHASAVTLSAPGAPVSLTDLRGSLDTGGPFGLMSDLAIGRRNSDREGKNMLRLHYRIVGTLEPQHFVRSRIVCQQGEFAIAGNPIVDSDGATHSWAAALADGEPRTCEAVFQYAYWSRQQSQKERRAEEQRRVPVELGTICWHEGSITRGACPTIQRRARGARSFEIDRLTLEALEFDGQKSVALVALLTANAKVSPKASVDGELTCTDGSKTKTLQRTFEDERIDLLAVGETTELSHGYFSNDPFAGPLQSCDVVFKKYEGESIEELGTWCWRPGKVARGRCAVP